MGPFFIIMLSLFKWHEPGQSGLEQSNTLSTMEEISIIFYLEISVLIIMTNAKFGQIFPGLNKPCSIWAGGKI